ncbi:MAG TPA: hypothetical protein VGS19_25995 [Streptosporangiaceae bacterium]|nr:hypothetical protein [Streptosporangiaceae bacterium]
MALELETQSRQADVNATQQVAAQMTALAPALAQALGTANQFAASMATGAQQLAALEPGVHDLTSAMQAIISAQQIEQSFQTPTPNPAVSQAVQAWKMVGNLAQQRYSWLLSRWQQTHREQPSGTSIAMADPLVAGLNAYSAATAPLAGEIQARVQFPPPPAPGGATGPAAVVAWLQTCSQQLSGPATQITAATTPLGSTLSWANLGTTAANVLASEQALLAAAQRVAAALTGPVAPASLAGLLADLTALRLSACPDPIQPADRAVYGQRMAELVQALPGLLAAPTGAAAPTVPPATGPAPPVAPVVMLPVRLETRAFPVASGGTEFRIRVYVDSVHVNAHDPRLTPDEALWGQRLRAAAPTAAEWAQAAARFGPARAAYLLNPEPNAGTRTGPWAQAATTAALPDRWLAVGYGPDGVAIGAALGAPITLLLQVGPDPTVTPPAPASGGLAVDPGIGWMVDFGEAVTAGMGLSLFVDGGAAGTPAAGAATGSPTLSRLLVVGVRTGDATQTLTGLLNAHHYTSGLGLVSYGTPTNNTSEAPSGFTRTDPGYANSYAQEVLRPAATGDAARLAAALGVPPGVFAAAAPAPLTEQRDQQAMTAVTWPATWGSFLPLAGMGTTLAGSLRSWAVAWVRPGGPLPTLRVGPRPYGILPVVDLAGWVADPAYPYDAAGGEVAGVVRGLVSAWLAADPIASNPDFDALLARQPVSAEAWGRFAGIMPGWLQPNFDLGVTNTLIQASMNALPGQLAQIGTACGLGGPLTWPAGLVVLPDPLAPASPWPLVAPDGAMPWAAGTGPPAMPAAYLASLLAGTSAAQPAALLDFVARQSWAGTRGLPGGGWVFAPRGNLGDVPEPPPPPPADELHAATGYLAGRAAADFSSLFGGALDIAGYRLDAWVTALATSRLGRVRNAPAAGTFVGGFGWVENLVARPPLAPVAVPAEPQALADPANAGYQQAPSLQQAITAAVLRSGYLTHNPLTAGSPPPPPGAPFAIDLSSRRARLAGWLLDGVRQGQPLSVLLGYRFERALQEAALGSLIAAFRQAAPYNPVAVAGGGATAPTEAAVPTDVVDGVALYQLTQAAQQPPPLPSPLTTTQWNQAQPALTDLAEVIDAVSDAVTAQALHDLLTGGTTSVAATLDGVASGAVPPPALAFLHTPRTGIAVNHRILVPVPAGQPYPPPHWPATPRGQAEPALTAWVAGLLGDPGQVTAAVTLLGQTGAPLPGQPTTITLGSLGLGPLDVVALAGQPAELERLAVYSVINARPATAPPASGGTLDGNPAGAARPLSAVLSVARSAGQLIGTGRGADARDLSPANTVSDPGANLSDLAARVAAASAALASAWAAFQAALPGDPHPGSPQAAGTGVPAGAVPATLGAALLAAVMMGIPAAAPAGAGTAALQALANQARGAWSEVYQRQSAVAALEPPAGADPATELAARLAQLTAAFGGGFRALPQVTTSPPGLLAQAAALTGAATADPGQEPDAWLVKVSRVHAPVADLLDTCCAAEALGTGPPLALTVAQLPLPAPSAPGTAPAPAPWAGLPFTTPPAANLLSLAMVAPPPTGMLSALLVADWVEVIPSRTETTGLTYHYDAPDAQAPQAILLAVPANPGATAWRYADLVNTVASARDLAHVRGVDYLDLPGTARQVLPAAYFANPQVPPPGPWSPVLSPLGVPGNYLSQTQAPTITSVAGGPLEQAKTGQLTVTGQGFAPPGPAGPVPLPFSAFTVDGGDVTITGGRVTGTQATLNVAIAPQAVTGPRGLSVGTSTLPNCVTIVPQPRATGCDTTVLSQGMTVVTHVITVTGQALSAQTTATLTGSSLVHTQVTGVTATQFQLTATIDASEYEPYSDQSDGTGPVSKPVPGYRPPVHVSIGLTLTVSPAPGEPTAAFPITLDSIT